MFQADDPFASIVNSTPTQPTNSGFSNPTPAPATASSGWADFDEDITAPSMNTGF